jgi:hypothetical protein
MVKKKGLRTLEQRRELVDLGDELMGTKPVSDMTIEELKVCVYSTECGLRKWKACVKDRRDSDGSKDQILDAVIKYDEELYYLRKALVERRDAPRQSKYITGMVDHIWLSKK